MKKRLIIFGLIYFTLDILSILTVFAWKSFGGSHQMNFFQKAITFFFTFPSDILLGKEGGLGLFLLINTVFWTVALGVILEVYSQIKALTSLK